MAIDKRVNTLTTDEVTHLSAQPLHDRRHCLALGVARAPAAHCAPVVLGGLVNPNAPPPASAPGCVEPIITCPGGQDSRERHTYSHT